MKFKRHKRPWLLIAVCEVIANQLFWVWVMLPLTFVELLVTSFRSLIVLATDRDKVINQEDTNIWVFSAKILQP